MLPDLRSLTLECTRHGAEVGALVKCTEPGVTDDNPEAVSQAVYKHLQNHPELVDTLTQEPLSDGVEDEEVWNRMIYYWDNGVKKPVILPEEWKSGPTSLIGITSKCRQRPQTRTTKNDSYVIYVLKATLYMQFSEQRRKDLDKSKGSAPNYPSVITTRAYPQGYKEPEYGRTFILPTLNAFNREVYTEMDKVLRDFLKECQGYRHRSDLPWHPETNSLYNTVMDNWTGHNPFPVGWCGWEDPQTDPDGELWWGAAIVDNVERDPETGEEILPNPNANSALPDPAFVPLAHLAQPDDGEFDDEDSFGEDLFGGDDEDMDDVGSGSGNGFDEDRVDMLLRELRDRPSTHANPIPILKELDGLMSGPDNAVWLGTHCRPVVDTIRCAHVHKDKLWTIVWGLRVLIKIFSNGFLEEPDHDRIVTDLLDANIMPVLVDLLRSEHEIPELPKHIKTLSADLLNRIFATNVVDRAIGLFNQRKRLGLQTAIKLFMGEDSRFYYWHYLKLMWHVLKRAKYQAIFVTDQAVFNAITLKLRAIIHALTPMMAPNSSQADGGFSTSLAKTATEVLELLTPAL